MDGKWRYVLAGSLMTLIGATVFDNLTRHYQVSIAVVLGFLCGVLWWWCVGKDWPGNEKTGPTD